MRVYLLLMQRSSSIWEVISEELFLCWFSGNLNLTIHKVQIWIWKQIFLSMKLWIWKWNSYKFMKSHLKCPWNHEYEKATLMKSWIWKPTYSETMNMEPKMPWNCEYEFQISVKTWIWNGIWWNVSCEIFESHRKYFRTCHRWIRKRKYEFLVETWPGFVRAASPSRTVISTLL